jgi:hypothetical protein
MFVTACNSNARHSLPTPTTAAHQVTTTGTIVGRMHVVGGTEPGIDVPLVGEVFVARGGTNVVVARTTTDAAGRFRVRVAPGNYDVSGSSSKSASPQTESVIVRSGGTESVDLVVAVG